MSDTTEQTPGNRLDTALVEVERAWNDLRAKLAARASELSDDINTAVDELSTKVDELQEAWEARSDA